eukprot:363363-Chlamydomonas_euryale.AAC.7
MQSAGCGLSNFSGVASQAADMAFGMPVLQIISYSHDRRRLTPNGSSKLRVHGIMLDLWGKPWYGTRHANFHWAILDCAADAFLADWRCSRQRLAEKAPRLLSVFPAARSSTPADIAHQARRGAWAPRTVPSAGFLSGSLPNVTTGRLRAAPIASTYAWPSWLAVSWLGGSVRARLEDGTPPPADCGAPATAPATVGSTPDPICTGMRGGRPLGLVAGSPAIVGCGGCGGMRCCSGKRMALLAHVSVE